MRKLAGERGLMRIFIGESDRWEHRPIHAAVGGLFRREGLAAGAAVGGAAVSGAAGAGAARPGGDARIPPAWRTGIRDFRPGAPGHAATRKTRRRIPSPPTIASRYSASGT